MSTQRKIENPDCLTTPLKDYTTEKGTPICLHENKIFSVFFNGYYHYVEFNNALRGAVMIPRFPNGDLLLVNLRRAPVVGQSLEFPRGGVNKDETLEQGAIREIKEETGFEVFESAATCIGRFGADTATLNGFQSVFLVDIPENAEPGEYDHDEINWPVRISEKQLSQKIRSGEIVDGISMAAWTLYQAHCQDVEDAQELDLARPRP